MELIETALKFGWENILYFDTDSIYCLANDFTKKVLYSEINLNDELGGWELEKVAMRSQFTAPKRYKLEIKPKDGESPHTIIKAGGINFDFYKEHTRSEEMEFYMNEYGMTRKEALEHIDIPFDEVNIISSSWEVQRAYRVRGGTIIEFQTKKMEVQDKYIEIYKANS